MNPAGTDPELTAEERLAAKRVLLVSALENAVRRMRVEQVAFFKGDRTSARVQGAKKCEREVDRLLAELDRAREPAPPPPAQGSLGLS